MYGKGHCKYEIQITYYITKNITINCKVVKSHFLKKIVKSILSNSPLFKGVEKTEFYRTREDTGFLSD